MPKNDVLAVVCYYLLRDRLSYRAVQDLFSDVQEHQSLENPPEISSLMKMATQMAEAMGGE